MNLHRDQVTPIPKPSRGKKDNRSVGLKAQKMAARKLRIRTRYRSQLSDEERWGGSWRTEIKSGKQVNALAAVFYAAESQSGAHQAIGDVRPFRLVAVPPGWGQEGIVCVRMSTWTRYVEPAVWGES